VTTIDQVDVQSLRGITSSTLALNGKWLFLLGENGTGKSSFIDALEFFFTGSVAHLQGIQSISVGKHLHHVDREAEDMSVAVRFSGSVLREVSRNGSGVLSSVPAQLSDYFASAALGTFILRRDQLLRFVCSQPADRFRALDAFIGLESLDDIELNMKRARDEAQGRVSGLERERSDSLDRLAARLGVPVSSEQEALVRMNDILEKAGVSTIRSFDDENAADGLRLQVKKAALKDKGSGLNLNILARLSALSSSLDLDTKIAEIVTVQRRHSTSKKEEKSRLVALFNSARLLIPGEAAAVVPCPLCGQDIDSRQLLDRINKYLNDNAAWTSDAQDLRVKSEAVCELLKTQSTRLQELAVLLDEEPQSAQAADEARQLMRRIQELQRLLVNVEHVDKLLNRRDFIEVEGLLSALCREVQTAAKGRMEHLALSPEDESAKELERVLTTVGLYAKQLKETDARLAIARARLQLSDAVYECFKSAKQKEVQGVFDRLQNHVSDWYACLHPDDEHRNVRLGIDLGQRASAKLYVDSFGQTNQDPRAYSSEGHLDSLGLVIFLAFAKEFQGSCTLLVLDDVVSSVDAQHRQRICDLLIDEFPGWQLVITTHDRIWFEELWRSAVAHNIGANIRKTRIVRWSRSVGPVLEPYLSLRERIDRFVEEGDSDSVGSQGRTYLESLLKELCAGTAASLRYREGADYTVGELLPALESRLGRMDSCAFKTLLLQRISELRAISFVANMLSHDAQSQGALSSSEIASFWSAVTALHDAYACPACGKNQLAFDETVSAVVCRARGCEQPLVARFR